MNIHEHVACGVIRLIKSPINVQLTELLHKAVPNPLFSQILSKLLTESIKCNVCNYNEDMQWLIRHIHQTNDNHKHDDPTTEYLISTTCQLDPPN